MNESIEEDFFFCSMNNTTIEWYLSNILSHWFHQNRREGTVNQIKSNQIIFILKFQNTYLVIYVYMNMKEMRKGQPNNNTVILGRCPFTS